MNKYYCFNRNKDYKDVIERIIQERKGEIFSFFGVDKTTDLNFNIYVYDTIELLSKGLKDRGFDGMPSYMCACQKDEDNSINFFEPKNDPEGDEWSKEEYEKVIFHELIHALQFSIYGSQPEWLTEGVAKYFDGTYEKGIKYLLEQYIHKTNIPSMKELELEFGNHEYDSYDYAYLMISYLIETLGHEKFLDVIGDKEKLTDISHNLIIKAICYYNKKYFNDEFYNNDPLNPNWLFHGSPLMLNEIDLMQSSNSDENKANTDKAVFVTSSWSIASAYAFKDNIKKDSSHLDWDFIVSSSERLPIMQMKNVLISNDLEGYIYVFANDGTFKNEPAGSLQFKSYNKLAPIRCEKIDFNDYNHLYEYEKQKNK
ncbi:MAG: hypothetical protein PHT75_01230 [Bacilli bacterium]|nr:hypothetical protein [Bacilli bacterium]MDD3304738.1 hypothetical protein [Bacilli bacterium]MDD4053583.1 hypothetical protein [Bacilli bacterium]MDD4411082.1 hypothetical protein [Bacilli bacterium]